MEVADDARRSAAAQVILDEQLRLASLTAAAGSAAERAPASAAAAAGSAAGWAPANAAEQVALTTAAPAIAVADQPTAADADESAQQEPIAKFKMTIMFSAVAFVLFLKP